MRTARTLFMIAAVIAAANSCGRAARESRSPVLLIIDSLQASQGGGGSAGATGTLTSDVQTIVTSPPPCSNTQPCATVFNDTGQAIIHLISRDIGVPAFTIAPSVLNQVTLGRYHVVYRRTDGRNTPGVDVPFAFDGAVTGTVPATGSLTVGFELVRHVAKLETPLVQLVSNGVIITTIAEVTFYGRDAAGNEISVAGSMTIDFGNFGDK